LKEPDLWGALVIILLTIYLSTLTVVDKNSFGFFVGPLAFIHRMSLIGGFWIAIVTPIYYLLKHHRPNRIKALIRIHLFGNLIAFMLISIHFTFWITTVSFIGTGLALFVSVFILVVTGLLQRFTTLSSRRPIRFLHVSTTTAFYLILAIHILAHMVHL
jgi:hypothetical protein